MVRAVPGGRWAAGLLAWLGMVLSVCGQVQEPPASLAAAPLPAASAPDIDSSEESQTEGPQRAVPAPILVPAPSAGPPPAQPPPVSQAVKLPERWPLMRTLQGTWLGAGLENQRVQILGWTQGNFTASTDRDSN